MSCFPYCCHGLRNFHSYFVFWLLVLYAFSKLWRKIHQRLQILWEQKLQRKDQWILRCHLKKENELFVILQFFFKLMLKELQVLLCSCGIVSSLSVVKNFLSWIQSLGIDLLWNGSKKYVNFVQLSATAWLQLFAVMTVQFVEVSRASHPDLDHQSCYQMVE